MKRIVFAMLVACGSKSPPPAEPVQNVEPATQGEAGAGDARVIQRTGQGGVIELQADRERSMRAADQEMEAHCGKGAYTITQEGEEAVADPNAAPAPHGETTTRTATAWRVHYVCAH
jgi:hypothetical protein